MSNRIHKPDERARHPQTGERALYYLLNDEGEPEPCWPRSSEDYQKIDALHTSPRKILQQDIIEINGKSVMVSTVFLIIDHSFLRQGPPVLWETMVFDEGIVAELHETQLRYRSREDALAGHRKVVDLVRVQIKL